MWMAKLKP